MEKEYLIGDRVINVDIEEGMVHIINGEPLRNALIAKPGQSTVLLITQIKQDYVSRYGKPLVIGDNSFITEILGHLYIEYLLLKYRRLLQTALFFGLYKRLRQSCEVIDCGEAGKDPNRWFWDKLAPYGNRIARWLSKIDAWPTTA
ncbi:hypothetical protein [Parapedobacter koreensis]|uniref:Uncharacterized protein n=1 Tax=Parapedobacter koreensis TaxID=332977 RepID=A0A1H7N0E8_9SPHI|nr:hypothetical protein [Parapedobacter koreensis]SEL16963.1 hypothetical protein SAMN05421740_103709 [Parapedobacter koreensis]